MFKRLWKRFWVRLSKNREAGRRLSRWRRAVDHFYPAIATHNTQLIEHTKGLAASLSRERFEFQMLLGVREKLQREFAGEGYRVRVYVPYGDFWYPYLMRRIGERPANGLFLLKNLFR